MSGQPAAGDGYPALPAGKDPQMAVPAAG